MKKVKYVVKVMAKKSKVSWRDFVIPFLLVVGIAFYCWYAVNNPQDAIVADYLTADRIWWKLGEHVNIVLISASLAILTAFPLGLILTRPKFRRFTSIVVNLVNVGQTVPSLAVIAIFVGILGIGLNTAVFAIWLYSLLPILANTITGINCVPPHIIDAAKGMGMTNTRILFKIEVPLASSVILAGIRTAVVINIATAIVAAFVGAGGLGDLIIAGNNIRRFQILIVGAGLSATMAVVTDQLLEIVQKLLPQQL